MARKFVVADYEYVGEDDSQLTFNEGDRIEVLEQDETGWWTGRLEKNGVEGYFPSTYVKPVESGGPPPVPPVAPGDGYDGNATGLSKMPSGHTPVPSGSRVVPLETEEKRAEMPKIRATAPQLKEGGAGTTSVMTPVIDYNNYFANAQKVCSIPDDFEGDSSAAMENYYSAEVLNLNFNPNAKSRFGLASHYMSMFAAISMVFLGMSAWAWADGSPYLEAEGLADPDICLFVGLYCFFGGIAVFAWEYTRGDIRVRKSVPLRSMFYFILGVPMMLTLCTALGAVLWTETALMSGVAWYKNETYERRKRRGGGKADPQTRGEKLLAAVNPKACLERLKLRLVNLRQQSQVRKYAFVTAYLLFNVAYILYWADFYAAQVDDVNLTVEQGFDGELLGFTQAELRLVSLKNTGATNASSFAVLSQWFPVAKMFGNLLDINCAFILLPVCRSFISTLYNISSDQRGSARLCSFLLSFMPLDKALQFHKMCALLIAIGSVAHTWAHFNHFAAVPSTYEEVFGATVWLSGSLIIMAMHFLFCTSFAAVRHGKFELFWYTHHLFVLFFVVILLHGRGTVNPNFWKWFLVPGALYAIERTLRARRSRQAVGVVSVLHMNTKNARVFVLELEKTGPICSHAEGQYVFIKAPIISGLQWHPFTISSAPDQKTLTLHIRNQGDGSWTDRLQQFFQAMNPGKSYGELYHRKGDLLVPQSIGPDGNNLICIDGPMAAPTQHLGQYSTSIIVGAGIGVTPVRSTLQSIVYFRFARGIGKSFPDNAYCVWIVNFKQLDAYRFMCRTLKEAEDELFNLRAKDPKGMADKLLQFHIFVTSTPKSEEEWAKARKKEVDVTNASGDRQRDLALWGTRYDDLAHESAANNVSKEEAPFTEEDIWRCLREPADQPTQLGDIIIHKGRPKWDSFFQPIQTAHVGQKIGCMFCGPDIIAKDLKRACGKYTDFESNTVFLLHKENF